MESFLIITDLFACIIEAYVFHKVLLINYEYKYTKYKKYVPLFVLMTGIMLHLGTKNGAIWGSFFLFIETFLFSVVFLKGSVGNKLGIINISVLVVLCNDMFYTLLYIIIMGKDAAYNLFEKPLNRSICIIIAKMSLLTILCLYIRYCKKKKQKEYFFSDIEITVLLVMGLSNITVTTLIYYLSSNYFIFFYLMYAIIILLNFLFYYWIKQYMQKVQDDIMFYQIDERKQEMNQLHFQQSKLIYDRLRELRHDFKHHVAYMDYLLQEKDYDKIVAYLDDVKGDINGVI